MASHPLDKFVEWVQVYPIGIDERLKPLCACGQSNCEWVLGGKTAQLNRAGNVQYACSDCLGEVLLSMRWHPRFANGGVTNGIYGRN